MKFIEIFYIRKISHFAISQMEINSEPIVKREKNESEELKIFIIIFAHWPAIKAVATLINTDLFLLMPSGSSLAWAFSALWKASDVCAHTHFAQHNGVDMHSSEKSVRLNYGTNKFNWIISFLSSITWLHEFFMHEQTENELWCQFRGEHENFCRWPTSWEIVAFENCRWC